MKTPRLVVLLSGEGSNFKAILDNILNGNLKAKISAVISDDPIANGLTIARQHGIPTFVLPGYHIEGKWARHPSFDESDYIRPFFPDLVILAGYKRILSPKVVAEWNNRILNIHPSLLPAYKGKDALWKAWTAGVSPVGCTVHLVVNEVDSGEIRGQAEVDNNLSDSLQELTRKVKEAEHKLYWRTIATYLSILKENRK